VFQASGKRQGPPGGLCKARVAGGGGGGEGEGGGGLRVVRLGGKVHQRQSKNVARTGAVSTGSICTVAKF